jgi:hypothetical protein
MGVRCVRISHLSGTARQNRISTAWFAFCLVLGALVAIAVASSLGIPQRQWNHLLPTIAIGAAAGSLVWLLVCGVWRVLVGVFGGIAGGLLAGWGTIAVWGTHNPDTLDAILGDLIVFASVWILGLSVGVWVGVKLETRHRDRISRETLPPRTGRVSGALVASRPPVSRFDDRGMPPCVPGRRVGPGSSTRCGPRPGT